MNVNVYSEAIRLFKEQDPVGMAARAGAVYDRESQKICLKYLHLNVEVDFSTGEMETREKEVLTKNEKVFILQYLTAACGVRPRGSWLSFFQLPDGPNHHTPFVLEAIRPLAEDFGARLDDFRERVLALGGQENGMGDFGATIQVFPNIELAVCLWEGDEEFPANANILFDISAPLHLKTAQLYVLGIELSRKIRGVSGQQYA